MADIANDNCMASELMRCLTIMLLTIEFILGSEVANQNVLQVQGRNKPTAFWEKTNHLLKFLFLQSAFSLLQISQLTLVHEVTKCELRKCKIVIKRVHK